jgi:hypothetical protein
MAVGPCLPAGRFARYKILFDTIYFLKILFIPGGGKTFSKKVFKAFINQTF